MLKNFINKIYGNSIVFSSLRGQHNIPYLTKEKLHALRDTRLREVVKYAAETVPYYQSLFQRVGIAPDEIQTVEDLDRLPLIDKEFVCKNPHLFVSTSRMGRRSIQFITSGSTGKPLKVYHDQYSLLSNIAFGVREKDVIKKVCGNVFKYKKVYITYKGGGLEELLNFYKKKTFRPFVLKEQFLSVLEPIDRIVEVINSFRPHVIVSFGSYLEMLFKRIALRKIQLYLPRAVVYGADSMTDEGRRFIEEKFGIPVLSTYQAIESLKIGFFCEERKGFHLHEDLCHVKIVNRSGEKVKNGEKGEVVISNFVNRGTVFLNYRLGDIASISGKSCPCGRNLLLLSELEGRMEDILFLPNGKFIHPRIVWKVFKGKNEVLQYQLIQYEPERFELRLVTDDREAYQRIIDDIITDLKHLLGDSAIIESEYFQELESQNGGKFRPVISFCKLEEFA